MGRLRYVSECNDTYVEMGAPEAILSDSQMHCRSFYQIFEVEDVLDYRCVVVGYGEPVECRMRKLKLKSNTVIQVGKTTVLRVFTRPGPRIIGGIVRNSGPVVTVSVQCVS